MSPRLNFRPVTAARRDQSRRAYCTELCRAADDTFLAVKRDTAHLPKRPSVYVAPAGWDTASHAPSRPAQAAFARAGAASSVRRRGGVGGSEARTRTVGRGEQAGLSLLQINLSTNAPPRLSVPPHLGILLDLFAAAAAELHAQRGIEFVRSILISRASGCVGGVASGACIVRDWYNCSAPRRRRECHRRTMAQSVPPAYSSSQPTDSLSFASIAIASYSVCV
eukprot:358198-Chlamydomonas_euryale.AAC.3